METRRGAGSEGTHDAAGLGEPVTSQQGSPSRRFCGFWQRGSVLLPLALTLALSCSRKPAVETPVSNLRTSLQLAPSHRCKGGICTCRSPEHPYDQDETNLPLPGVKRFEFRMDRSIDFSWVEIEGRGVFVKSAEEMGPVCVYVDLPVGKRVQIRYHTRATVPEQGVVPKLLITEYAQTSWWYRTAELSCGRTGIPCDRSEMKTWINLMADQPRYLHDPCGSTRLEAATWSSPERRMPHFESVTMEITLFVESYEPKSAPGSTECERSK